MLATSLPAKKKLLTDFVNLSLHMVHILIRYFQTTTIALILFIQQRTT